MYRPRDKSAIWPRRLFVAPDALNDEMTERVISRLPEAEVTHLESSADPISELQLHAKQAEGGENEFSLGKRWLLLTRHKGDWLKACPGTNSHVCCNLWVVNPGEGCPLDCTYCYLQSYLKRNPTLKLYTNTDDMCEAIRQRAEKEPNRLFRVGTGELIDSLVWDELTDLSLQLVPFFAKMPNLVLELKSKDTAIGNLLDMRDVHNGNTVVSWSVNAPEVTARDEAHTANLEERIDAAVLVAEAGYRVGLHFDPLIHFDGWEDAYRDTVRYIFSRLDPAHVAWVSVSTLRYRSEMQRVMIERFPESRLPFGEQFLAKDGKLRYVQPLRLQMVGFVWKELKAIRSDMPVYMCMESSAAWRQVNEGPPAAGSELVEIFSRRGRLPVLQP